MRILIVIPTMGRGGAEVQAKQLAIELVRRGHQVGIVVLLRIDEFAAELRSCGVQIWSLGMRKSIPSPSGAARFLWLVRTWKPDLIQGWMYAANLLSGVAARLSGIPIAWAIRSSAIDPERRSSQRLMHMGAHFSPWMPDKIFYNSSAGLQFHASMGYRGRSMAVIPNGFDVQHFRPDNIARAEVRSELGLSANAPLVGIVARFDADKDHATFFEAAGMLRRRVPKVKFLIVGRGFNDNPVVQAWMSQSQTTDACIFTGQRSDTARLNNAMDLATLSSQREGFPNALGEAMACGIPCVATAAGDSAELVGDSGLTVPIRDAVALAGGWERVLRLSSEARRDLGATARARIVQHFALTAIVSRYEDEWNALASRRQR